ncbi:MAG: hypothetical protein U0441_09560 [Polyangiaceae bacterium]
MSDEENELRRYLPSRERAQELCDQDAAEERIARAIESEGIAAAKQPTEHPPVVVSPGEPAAKTRAPVRDPAAVSVEPRSSQRGRKPMSNVMVSVLAIVGVLAPVTLAFVLWPRPHDTEGAATMTSATATDRAPPPGASAETAATATPSGTVLPDPPDAAIATHAPDPLSPPTGTSAPSGSAPKHVGPANSAKPANPGTGATTDAPIATTQPAAPPEPTGSAPRYGDPDF